jgi:hypothetical protein
MPRKAETDPALRAKHSADAAMGGRAVAANRRAARDAHFQSVAEEREAEGEDLADVAPPDLDGIALDADGQAMPTPSRSLSMYPDGHAEMQLTWGRYQAGRERAIKVQALRRELIAAKEVREWCASRMAVVNRALATVGGLPSPTPDQVAWLAHWEKRTREELGRDGIA